jgi:hypothetical protein
VIARRAHLGIASDAGWMANSIEIPPGSTEGIARDEFIRAAVAGCRLI